MYNEIAERNLLIFRRTAALRRYCDNRQKKLKSLQRRVRSTVHITQLKLQKKCDITLQHIARMSM